VLPIALPVVIFMLTGKVGIAIMIAVECAFIESDGTYLSLALSTFIFVHMLQNFRPAIDITPFVCQR
jgi:hypothetical protein